MPDESGTDPVPQDQAAPVAGAPAADAVPAKTSAEAEEPAPAEAATAAAGAAGAGGAEDPKTEAAAGAGNRGRPSGGGGGGRGRGGGANNVMKDSARLLHVSGQSPVKQVAGAISWISREGECPRLLATLAPAINQAAKAVAIARKFLEDDKIDIAVYPMFTPGRRRQDESFTFLLRKNSMTRGVQADVGGFAEDGSQELKVSKQSNPGTVAGAIAARVREGQRVVLSSIGPRSVSKAISSIAIARQYLSEDGVDISFRPSFLNIEFEDGRRSSCLQFQLLAQQI